MERYRDGFYRNYLIYTGLETDLLFFVVCDAMFLTKVKHLTLVQYSRVTFLSLLFSLLIQYPLLKCIHRMGNRKTVRAGSIFMLLSAFCITFSTGFFMVLIGGFLKCIGHTFNSIGTAVLKNRLETDHNADQYVDYQSDANTMACAFMMLTSLLCGYLFHLNEYFPMYACILFSAAGVASSWYISRDERSSADIISAGYFRQMAEAVPDFTGRTDLCGLCCIYRPYRDRPFLCETQLSGSPDREQSGKSDAFPEHGHFSDLPDKGLVQCDLEGDICCVRQQSIDHRFITVAVRIAAPDAAMDKGYGYHGSTALRGVSASRVYT